MLPPPFLINFLECGALPYNYLELVNDVNKRLNEVPLTSGNFSSATGYAADVKSYVNASLNRINREEFEWPFNHASVTETLVVEQSKYSYPLDVKSVAFDTFRLKGDEALNANSGRLRVLDYEELLNKFPDYEFNPEDHKNAPQYVTRNRDLSFTISPPPDKTYDILYEYYRLPVDLVDWDDVPTLPEQFRWVVLEGALYYAYMFRGGVEEASLSNQLFRDGIKDMRKIYINRTEYARSTVIRS